MIYYTYVNPATMDLGEAIWRIAVCRFSVPVVALFLTCSGDHTFFRWTTKGKNRSRDGYRVLFLLPSSLLRLVDKRAFTKLSDDLSFDLTHALLPFRALYTVALLEASCVGYHPCSVAQATVELVQECTVQSRARATNGNFLPSETGAEGVAFLLSE